MYLCLDMTALIPMQNAKPFVLYQAELLCPGKLTWITSLCHRSSEFADAPQTCRSFDDVILGVDVVFLVIADDLDVGSSLGFCFGKCDVPQIWGLVQFLSLGRRYFELIRILPGELRHRFQFPVRRIDPDFMLWRHRFRRDSGNCRSSHACQPMLMEAIIPNLLPLLEIVLTLGSSAPGSNVCASSISMRRYVLRRPHSSPGH
jgi:hypothetical protein